MLSGGENLSTVEERALAFRLVGEGNSFKAKARVGSRRQGDGWIGPTHPVVESVDSVVELKVLGAGVRAAAGAGPRQLRAAVADSLARGGQAPSVIVDATNASLAPREVLSVVEALRTRHASSSDGPLWHLRVIVDTVRFDETFSGF